LLITFTSMAEQYSALRAVQSIRQPLWTTSRRDVNILFTIGGDGTQRGGNELFQQSKRRGHALSVVGIPKTVDNDVAFVARTFGHLTAVEEAVRVLDCAHTNVRITARIFACPVCGQVHNSGSKRMKTTVTLTDENAAIVAQYAELTGFTQEELTNRFLADYFAVFDDEDESFINETIGSMYFKDRKSAERVQAWLELERPREILRPSSVCSVFRSNCCKPRSGPHH
jgi:hypothetical protein